VLLLFALSPQPPDDAERGQARNPAFQEPQGLRTGWLRDEQFAIHGSFSLRFGLGGTWFPPTIRHWNPAGDERECVGRARRALLCVMDFFAIETQAG
jgi:hypothetical protein